MSATRSEPPHNKDGSCADPDRVELLTVKLSHAAENAGQMMEMTSQSSRLLRDVRRDNARPYMTVVSIDARTHGDTCKRVGIQTRPSRGQRGSGIFGYTDHQKKVTQRQSRIHPLRRGIGDFDRGNRVENAPWNRETPKRTAAGPASELVVPRSVSITGPIEGKSRKLHRENARQGSGA